MGRLRKGEKGRQAEGGVPGVELGEEVVRGPKDPTAHGLGFGQDGRSDAVDLQSHGEVTSVFSASSPRFTGAAGSVLPSVVRHGSDMMRQLPVESRLVDATSSEADDWKWLRNLYHKA
jgi:hypothetical protein